MKSTIPGMILGGVMALTLAACNTTPMNSDTSMGRSSAGTTTSSADGTSADGTNKMRGAAPVNCTTNVSADGTNAANTPGAKCPTESH
jgi:hypothetical protein